MFVAPFSVAVLRRPYVAREGKKDYGKSMPLLQKHVPLDNSPQARGLLLLFGAFAHATIALAVCRGPGRHQCGPKGAGVVRPHTIGLGGFGSWDGIHARIAYALGRRQGLGFGHDP